MANAIALSVRLAAVVSAVLLAGVARHGDPLGIGGSGFVHLCRTEAQAAVDSFPGDLDAAHSLAAAMTFNDLISYTLDSLDAYAEADPRDGDSSTNAGANN